MNTDPDPKTLEEALGARSRVVGILVVKKRNDKVIYDSCGSGFVIKSRDNSCIVITNAHVLNGDLGFDVDNDQIVVRFYTGGKPDELLGLFIAQHAYVDAAAIRVNGVELPALEFVDSNIPIGTTAIPVGYCNPDPDALPVPETHDGLLLTGIPALAPGSICAKPVHAVQGDTVRKTVALSCPTLTGFSGGPVICTSGVIGVTTGGRKLLSMAITTTTVKQVLRKWLKIPKDEEKTMHHCLMLYMACLVQLLHLKVQLIWPCNLLILTMYTPS